MEKNKPSEQQLPDGKRSPDDLQIDTRHIRDIIDLSPVAIGVMEYPDYRYVLMNRACLKLINRKEEDVIGKTVREVFPEVEAQGIIDTYDRVVDSGSPMVMEEFPLMLDYRNDGVIRNRYLNLTIELLKTDEGRVRLLMVRVTDVTELVESRRKVEESERKYKALFESIDEGVTTIRVVFEQGTAVDFIYLEHNEALARMTGITDDVVGRRISEIMPGLDPFWLKTYADVIRSGESIRFERQVKELNDGWFDIFACRPGAEGTDQVTVVYKNITERKRQEQNLAFLAELSQEITHLNTLDETMKMLGERIAAYFRVPTISFAEIDEAEETANVTHDWHRPDLPGRKGIFRLSDYHTDEFRQTLHSGKTYVVYDAVHDDRVKPSRPPVSDDGAFVCVPILKDGRWRFLLSIMDTGPHAWRADEIALLEEITARIWARVEKIKTEEALRYSEQRLQSLIQNLPGSAVFILDRNFTYQLAQGEALVEAGFRESDFTGRKLWEVLPGETVAEYKPYYEKVFAGGTFHYEHRAHQHDYITRGVPLRNPAGEIDAALAVSYDITDRKTAEEALRLSEEKYRTLFSSIDEGFVLGKVILDEEGIVVDYRILEVNPAYEKLTGLTKEAVLNKTVREITPGIEQAWIDTVGHVATTGKSVRFEYGVAALDRIFETYISPVSNRLDGQFVAVFQETTARRKEEERQAFLLKLNDALRPLTDPEEIRSRAMQVMGDQLQVSRAAYVDAESETGHMRVISDYTHGVEPWVGTISLADFGAALGRDFAEGKTVVINDTQTDERFADSRDTYALLEIGAAVGVPLVKNGHVVAAMGVHNKAIRTWKQSDIRMIEQTAERTWEAVERARARQEVDMVEQRLRAMADTAPVLIWEVEEAGILFVNQHYLDFFGVGFEAVRGTNWVGYLHPDDAAGYLDAFTHALTERSFFSYEGRWRRADGTYRWLRTLGRPVNAHRFVGCSLDVTEHREAEDKIRESEHRLRELSGSLEEKVQQRTAELEEKNRELQKMNKELESFTYISSHDLQEPLRKIQTFASRIIATEQEQLSDKAKDYFHRMTGAATHMHTLIQDLLAFSRLATTERTFERLHPLSVIEQVTSELREVIKEKHAVIETGTLQEIPLIRFQFYQLMHNLISNALKFSTPDRAPHILIESDLVSGRDLSDRKLSSDNTYCHLTVSDNGIGFEKHFSEKIFEVFQRLHGKAQYAGTGIGLAIVKKVVENHHGVITAESEPGRGARFDIYLPA